MIKVASAQSLNLVQSLSGTGILGGMSINDIFTWAIGIGGGVALAIMIFGGVMYIASAGNSTMKNGSSSARCQKDPAFRGIYPVFCSAGLPPIAEIQSAVPSCEVVTAHNPVLPWRSPFQ